MKNLWDGLAGLTGSSPKALQKTEEEKSRFLKKCIKLLSRGAKEGVFQPNINFEIVALLAKEQAKMIRPSKALSNHSVSEVFNTILYTFLRGISTEKGIAILDRYLLKYKQKQLDWTNDFIKNQIYLF